MPPVITKPTPPVVTKVIDPVVTKAMSAVVTKAPPVVTKVIAPVVTKPTPPVVTKTVDPVVTKATALVVIKTTPSVVTKATASVVTKPTPPVFTNPTPPVTKTINPVVTKETPTVVTKTTSPVVTKPSHPIVTKAASPVVTKKPPALVVTTSPLVSTVFSTTKPEVTSTKSVPLVVHSQPITKLGYAGNIEVKSIQPLTAFTDPLTPHVTVSVEPSVDDLSLQPSTDDIPLRPIHKRTVRAGSKQLRRGSTMGNEVCEECSQRVFLLERISVENHVFHRYCLKCSQCGCQLNSCDYCHDITSDKFYCKVHFRDLVRYQSIKRSMADRGILPEQVYGEDSAANRPMSAANRPMSDDTGDYKSAVSTSLSIANAGYMPSGEKRFGVQLKNISPSSNHTSETPQQEDFTQVKLKPVSNKTTDVPPVKPPRSRKGTASSLKISDGGKAEIKGALVERTKPKRPPPPKIGLHTIATPYGLHRAITAEISLGLSGSTGATVHDINCELTQLERQLSEMEFEGVQLEKRIRDSEKGKQRC